MINTMTLQYDVPGGGSTGVICNLPQWGYEVDICENICMTWAADGSPHFSDQGMTHDYRKSRFTIFQPIKTGTYKHSDIVSFLRRPTAKPRGDSFNLKLGVTPTGFFPFGPDYGDHGTFVVKLLDVKQSGKMHDPYNWGSVDVELLLVTKPMYTAELPDIDDGPLQIGSVTGLMYPQNGFKPSGDFAFRNRQTKSGAAYIMDNGEVSDTWLTEWNQQATTAKMAQFITWLISSGRAGGLSMIAPAGYYAFGSEESNYYTGAGTYNFDFVNGDEGGTVYTLKNTRWDWWEINLKAWMATVA